MVFLYIVGAQCTGKTTLCKAIVDFISHRHPTIQCKLLSETARDTLALHQFSREDIIKGGDRCLTLQRLIMEHQIEKESAGDTEDLHVVISDRSGLDPMVYAELYCGSTLADQLKIDSCWHRVNARLRKGIIIVCEPVQGWLFDDGIRLMPRSWVEWQNTHEQFGRVLNEHEHPYTVLPPTISSLDERVKFVIEQLHVTGILQ